MSGGSAKMASSSSTAMTVALVSERRSSSGGRDEAAGALGPAVSITGYPSSRDRVMTCPLDMTSSAIAASTNGVMSW